MMFTGPSYAAAGEQLAQILDIPNGSNRFCLVKSSVLVLVDFDRIMGRRCDVDEL